MGFEVVRRLRDAGHTVIGVDIAGGEVTADLSSPHGRAEAVEQVMRCSGGVLDGAVLAAGLGPAPKPGRTSQIARVNYLGVVELLERWRPALARGERAKVVVISSNSTTTVPLVPRRTVAALLAGDTEKAIRSVRFFGKNSPTLMYGATKIAVSRWIRRHAVTAAWAGSGIRLNALAPGAVRTPLLEEQMSAPRQARAVESFPVPIGGFGDPGQMADWACFMTSDAADFLCGSILFVDGGTDAYFRADDWPAPVPARGLLRYARRFHSWTKS